MVAVGATPVVSTIPIVVYPGPDKMAATIVPSLPTSSVVSPPTLMFLDPFAPRRTSLIRMVEPCIAHPMTIFGVGCTLAVLIAPFHGSYTVFPTLKN